MTEFTEQSVTTLLGHRKEWRYPLFQKPEAEELSTVNEPRGNLTDMSSQQHDFMKVKKISRQLFGEGRLLHRFSKFNFIYFSGNLLGRLAMTSGIQQEARFL